MPPWLGVVLLIAALTAMRMIYAGVMELRTDEAYYWTWSKEHALSFLDHPPMIAWFIRFGTAIFGDTNLGVRFGGIVAMLVMQLLLADIARLVGRRPPRLKLPRTMIYPIAYGAELIAKVSGVEPFVTLDGLRMARHYMFFDDSKARRELGYISRPYREGLSDAIAWFRSHGYLR